MTPLQQEQHKEEVSREETAVRLLTAWLHSGSLRTEDQRQNYLDVCEFLGVKPEVY